MEAQGSAPQGVGASTAQQSAKPGAPQAMSQEKNVSRETTAKTHEPTGNPKEGAEGQREDADGRLPGETKTEAEARKWKLKVYGQERELDEEALVREAQKGLASEERFTRAKEIEKKYQGMVEELQANPWKIFEVLGKDAHQMAEELLIEKLKWETATPEQRRYWEIERENATLKSERENEKKAREDEKKALEQEALERVKSESVQTIDGGIAEALREAGISKPTPAIVRRIAQKMLAYHDAHDGQLLDPKLALKQVYAEMRTESPLIFGALSDGDFAAQVEAMPDDFKNRLRNYFVSQVAGPSFQSATPKAQDKATKTTTQGSARRVKTSTDDFFKFMDKRYG